MRGRERSPGLVLLDAVGDYVLDPYQLAAPHRAIEVFPAPTWLEIFGLQRRIRYKHGRLAERITALRELDALLARLVAANPPLGPSLGGQLAARQASGRTGRDWKAVEDILDARLCAYVALLWGRTPLPNWVVTGDGMWQAGYIVVPDLRDQMRRGAATGRGVGQ